MSAKARWRFPEFARMYSRALLHWLPSWLISLTTSFQHLYFSPTCVLLSMYYHGSIPILEWHPWRKASCNMKLQCTSIDNVTWFVIISPGKIERWFGYYCSPPSISPFSTPFCWINWIWMLTSFVMANSAQYRAYQEVVFGWWWITWSSKPASEDGVTHTLRNLH